MVDSPNTLETLTTNAMSFVGYEVQGIVHYDGSVPREIEVLGDRARNRHYLAGALSGEGPNQSRWSVPPHVALANLPTYNSQGKMVMGTGLQSLVIDDEGGLSMPLASKLRLDAKAAKKFVMEYGVLQKTDIVCLERGTVLEERFREEEWSVEGPDEVSDIAVDNSDWAVFRGRLAHFELAQILLREAWRGSAYVVDVFLKTELDDGFNLRAFDVLAGRDTTPNHRAEIFMETEDLWKFICFLFLLDWTRGRIGVCGNPECPAPYFLKKRSTQKVCELGPCSEWAQRQYALKWWNKEGRKRRAKKSAKPRRRRREKQ